jgi:hypothetical protein
MKLMKILPLALASLGMAACVGAPDDGVASEEVPLDPQICTIGCRPPQVTPPSQNGLNLHLDTSAEQGDQVMATSMFQLPYPSDWVTHIDGINAPVSNLTAYVETTDSAPQDLCGVTTMSGTLYGYSPTWGYWYVVSSKSQGGVWVPESGSGLGYVPAYCDLTIEWAIPSGVNQVEIAARAVTSWHGTYYERQINEGAYWFY